MDRQGNEIAFWSNNAALKALGGLVDATRLGSHRAASFEWPKEDRMDWHDLAG